MILPNFKRTKRQQDLVANEVRTAHLVQSLWKAAEKKQRLDPAFVALLVQCGWTNMRDDGSGRNSTRTWRNRNLAEYLQIEYESDSQLSGELSKRFPRLKGSSKLIRSYTGITNYYKSLRPATLDFVRNHAKLIGDSFDNVSSRQMSPTKKIRSVVKLMASLGLISIRGKQISPLNGLTPILACLDPRRNFPIMNNRTEQLLRVFGAEQDSDGAVRLYRLIGQYGVRNSLELDVYSFTEDFAKIRKHTRRRARLGEFKDVGIKSEVAGMAQIVTNKIKIRKLHNKLTNDLRDYLMWRQITPKQGRFDVLVQDWRSGRDLLIEAKTSSSGPGGRTQIRQAIGQLFDYRLTHFKDIRNVDLAVLLRSQPSNDIQTLLASLGIEVLWFEGTKLGGTVSL